MKQQGHQQYEDSGKPWRLLNCISPSSSSRLGGAHRQKCQTPAPAAEECLAACNVRLSREILRSPQLYSPADPGKDNTHHNLRMKSRQLPPYKVLCGFIQVATQPIPHYIFDLRTPEEAEEYSLPSGLGCVIPLQGNKTARVSTSRGPS